MDTAGLHAFTHASFVLVFIAFAAASFYLYLECDRVPEQFRTTLRVSVVYLAIAAVNYLYMKGIYGAADGADNTRFPTSFRYIDWILTTPLMLLKFPLILGVGRKGKSFMIRLVLLDLAMIGCGFIGEVNAAPAVHYGFFLGGCVAWLGIIVSLLGALTNLPDRLSDAVRAGIRTMGLFVVVGWAIYPLGYFAPLLGVPGDVREIVYNVADLVNKVGLCLVVYVTAKREAIDRVEAPAESETDATEQGEAYSPSFRPASGVA